MTNSPDDLATLPRRDSPAGHPADRSAILKVPTVALGELLADILQSGRTVRFTVRGRSMHPQLQDGDIVEAEPVTGAGARVGDVLVGWMSSGDLAVHRLAAKGRRSGEWWVVLWPDAASQLNAPIAEANLLGRITGVERDGQQVGFARSVPSAVRRRAWLSLLRAQIPSPVRRAVAALLPPTRRR